MYSLCSGSSLVHYTTVYTLQLLYSYFTVTKKYIKYKFTLLHFITTLQSCSVHFEFQQTEQEPVEQSLGFFHKDGN